MLRDGKVIVEEVQMSMLETVKSRKFEARFDAGRHHRAKLGFVVLAMEPSRGGRCLPFGAGRSRCAHFAHSDVA